MVNPAKLTKSQAETLRAVLAAGGKVVVRHSNKRRGGVNKFTVGRLLDAGMLEETRATPAQMVAAGFNANGCPFVTGTYATAAGCLALNAYDTARAAKMGE